MAIFDEKIEIRERCKGVHCVDLGESFPTRKDVYARSWTVRFAWKVSTYAAIMRKLARLRVPSSTDMTQYATG